MRQREHNGAGRRLAWLALEDAGFEIRALVDVVQIGHIAVAVGAESPLPGAAVAELMMRSRVTAIVLPSARISVRVSPLRPDFAVVAPDPAAPDDVGPLCDSAGPVHAATAPADKSAAAERVMRG